MSGGDGLPFSEEFPHIHGCAIGAAKWAALYVVVIPLAVFFPVVMFGFALGFICAALLAAWEIGGKLPPAQPSGPSTDVEPHE